MQPNPTKAELDRIEKLARQCRSASGVDPTRIYCSVTGRPIGRLDLDVLIEMFRDIPEMDLEESVDDMLQRTLNSMRPAPSWNNMDRDSLHEYIQTRPAEVLAYCLNRLYARPDHLKLSSAERLRMYHQRITRWNHIKSHIDSGFDISDWLYKLVEIDAKYNLTTLPIPTDDRLITFGFFTDHVGLKLWFDAWLAWYRPLAGEYERRLKAAIQQSQWLKGNTLAKRAHFEQWLERKPDPIESAASPEKRKELKREKKNRAAADDFMLGLLDDMLDNESESSTPPAAKPIASAPVSVGKPPVRFGVKKQESK